MAKASRTDVMRFVYEVIYKECEEPAEEIAAVGRAMVAVGEALKGQSGPDARAIMDSVAAMLGVRLPK